MTAIVTFLKSSSISSIETVVAVTRATGMTTLVVEATVGGEDLLFSDFFLLDFGAPWLFVLFDSIIGWNSCFALFPLFGAVYHPPQFHGVVTPFSLFSPFSLFKCLTARTPEDFSTASYDY